MNKEELRKEIINIRKNISNKEELSKIIINKLINLDIYKKSKVVALYNSLKDEVDTNYLINESMKEKTILLPRIIDNKMIFIKVNKHTKFLQSTFKVQEPIGEEYQGNIDLIIVPGVAFDNKLNRMGYGMGYYDKYLSNKDIYKIGICFDSQFVNLVPTNELDIKMDMVITNNKIFTKMNTK